MICGQNSDICSHFNLHHNPTPPPPPNAPDCTTTFKHFLGGGATPFPDPPYWRAVRLRRAIGAFCVQLAPSVLWGLKNTTVDTFKPRENTGNCSYLRRLSDTLQSLLYFKIGRNSQEGIF